MSRSEVLALRLFVTSYLYLKITANGPAIIIIIIIIIIIKEII